MALSKTAPIALSLTLALAACSSKDGAKDGAKGSASPSGTAEAQKPKAEALTPKVAEDRLKAAGWTIDSSEPGEDPWPSTYVKITKGKDDKAVSATLWIDALGEPNQKGPKPVITMGKDALVRVGWTPATDSKTPAPDLAVIAKDIAAVSTPEKVTDDFFFGLSKLDEAAKKWKVKDDGSRGGGRAAPTGTVFNYRFLDGDGGTLSIHDVVFGEAVKKGGVRLVGTTVVGVDADDDATKKKLLDILAGS